MKKGYLYNLRTSPYKLLITKGKTRISEHSLNQLTEVIINKWNKLKYRLSDIDALKGTVCPFWDIHN